MNRCVLVLILQLLLSQAFSQYAFYNEHYVESKFTYEIVGETGAMNCLTDLGGNRGVGKPFVKDLDPEQSRIAYGISVSANYKRILSLRIQLVKGMVSADDRAIKPDASAARGRYMRNLSFQSNIRELSALVELSPLMLFAVEGRWLPSVDWYIFAGLGFYQFNPHTQWGNADIELWSLHTEGEGFSELSDRPVYRRNQLNIPLGTGVKFEMVSRMNLRVEVNCRKLFTDYLDDVSTSYIDPGLFSNYLPPRQARLASNLADRRTNNVTQAISRQEPRGNSKNNDVFFTLAVRFSLVIGRQRAP